MELTTHIIELLGIEKNNPGILKGNNNDGGKENGH